MRPAIDLRAGVVKHKVAHVPLYPIGQRLGRNDPCGIRWNISNRDFS